MFEFCLVDDSSYLRATCCIFVFDNFTESPAAVLVEIQKSTLKSSHIGYDLHYLLIPAPVVLTFTLHAAPEHGLHLACHRLLPRA